MAKFDLSKEDEELFARVNAAYNNKPSGYLKEKDHKMSSNYKQNPEFKRKLGPLKKYEDRSYNGDNSFRRRNLKPQSNFELQYHKLPIDTNTINSMNRSNGFATHNFRSGGWKTTSPDKHFVSFESFFNRMHESEQHRIANEHSIRSKLLKKGFYKDNNGVITDLRLRRKRGLS